MNTLVSKNDAQKSKTFVKQSEIKFGIAVISRYVNGKIIKKNLSS